MYPYLLLGYILVIVIICKISLLGQLWWRWPFSLKPLARSLPWVFNCATDSWRLKCVTEVLSLLTKLPDFPFLGRPVAMKTSALPEDLHTHHVYNVLLLFWLWDEGKVLTGDLDSHLLGRLLAYMHPLMISQTWAITEAFPTLCTSVGLLLFFTHWPHHIACGILTPTRDQTCATRVEVQNPNHWIAREVPPKKFWIIFYTDIYFNNAVVDNNNVKHHYNTSMCQRGTHTNFFTSQRNMEVGTVMIFILQTTPRHREGKWLSLLQHAWGSVELGLQHTSLVSEPTLSGHSHHTTSQGNCEAGYVWAEPPKGSICGCVFCEHIQEESGNMDRSGDIKSQHTQVTAGKPADCCIDCSIPCDLKNVSMLSDSLYWLIFSLLRFR